MKRLSLFLLIFVSGYRHIHAQSEAAEYNLKAAFVYNFTRYIEWQPSTMDNNFTIAILGPSPIMGPLNEIARTQTMNGKKIVVRQITNPEEIGFCHVLFIPRSHSSSLGIILSHIPPGILTVSEIDGAAREGVTMNFVIVNNKLKFEANLQSLSDAGLKASSELLKLALIVSKD